MPSPSMIAAPYVALMGAFSAYAEVAPEVQALMRARKWVSGMWPAGR